MSRSTSWPADVTGAVRITDPLASLAEASAYLGRVAAEADAQSAVLADMLEAATQSVEGVRGLTGQWFREADVRGWWSDFVIGEAAEYVLVGGPPTGDVTASLTTMAGRVIGEVNDAASVRQQGGYARALVTVPQFDLRPGEVAQLSLAWRTGGPPVNAPQVVKQAVLRLTAHLWHNRDPAVDSKLDWDDLARLVAPVAVRTGFEPTGFE